MCSPSLLLYCKTVIYNQPTRSISELLHMTLGNLLNFLCLDSLFVKKKKKNRDNNNDTCIICF